MAVEKLVPLGRRHTHEAQHCISQILGFQSVNKQHVDPHFPCSRRRSTMVDVGTQCSDGSSVIPKDPDKYLFTDASNIGRGAHWNSLTVSSVWSMTEKALHISLLELEAVQLTVLHWLKQLTGLTVLVASIVNPVHLCPHMKCVNSLSNIRSQFNKNVHIFVQIIEKN